MGFESSFQTEVLKYLNGLPGCVAENVSGNARQSGRPDVNACYRGRMLKLELKTPDNQYKASKKQELNLRRWKRSGAVTGVIYSLTFLKRIINEGPLKSGYYYKSEDNGCVSWINIPEVYYETRLD